MKSFFKKSPARGLLLTLLAIATGMTLSFLLPAILYRARHPRSAITKELYPAVADACGATPMQVERDIRLAIESGWETGNRETWGCLFPGQRKRPSNDLFIRRMAEILRLEETIRGRF